MKKYLNNYIATFFLAIGLLKPTGISDLATYVGGYWNLLSKALSGLMVIEALLIMLMALYFIKRSKRQFPFLICLFLFESWYMVADIINGISVGRDWKYVAASISLVLLVFVYDQNETLMILLKTILIILLICILINFFSIVVFPGGLYVDERNWWQNYFLGYKNRHIYFFLPYICIQAVVDISEKKRLSAQFYVMSIIIFISSILINSSTCVFSILLTLVGIVIFRNSRVSKFLTLGKEFIFSSILTVIFFLVTNMKFFGDLIYALFKKNATFTGRTNIWEASLRLIAQKPIFGCGAVSLENVDTSVWNVTFTQAHNKYLDILLSGGIIMLMIFAVLCWLVNRKLKKNKIVFSQIFVWTLGGYAILFLMESSKSDVFFFLIMYLAYIVESIEKERQNRLIKEGN